MKKILLLSLLLIFIPNVKAEINERKEIELINCDSVYNIWIKEDGETKRITLLAYTKEDGDLNEAIDQFVCTSLQKAETLEIEYDIAEKDKYNREQVWIYTDGNLLQSTLIRKGYGQVSNVFDNYQYLDSLCNDQYYAISENLGIWNYPDIKEKYCVSGLPIGVKTETKEVNQEKQNENKLDVNYLIFLNSGILLLVILLFKKVNYGKR